MGLGAITVSGFVAKWAALPAAMKIIAVAIGMLFVSNMTVNTVHTGAAIAVVGAHQMGIINLTNWAPQPYVPLHERQEDWNERQTYLAQRFEIASRAANVTGECHDDAGCNDNGKCNIVTINATVSVGTCECDKEYATKDSEDPCGYKRTPRWTVFLMQFVVGHGSGYFILDRGQKAHYFEKGITMVIFSPIIQTIWQLILWTIITIIATIVIGIPLGCCGGVITTCCGCEGWVLALVPACVVILIGVCVYLAGLFGFIVWGIVLLIQLLTNSLDDGNNIAMCASCLYWV